jgi:3-methyladenine DNA glycosylase AlkD
VIILALVEQVKTELCKLIVREKADFLPRFFKTNPGEYGAGDLFLGVSVPHQRKIAQQFYRGLSLAQTEELLREPYHEYRLTALFILGKKFSRANGEEQKKEIVDMYLRNTRYVNNWDLVDSSAEKILGPYLLDKEREILYRLAVSDNLWEQRIAIIATLCFIRHGQFGDTLRIAGILLQHEHDLIHKAVGWMLREVGKRDEEAELGFLRQHYKKMPRTMLRYAIEKFDPDVRSRFLKGEI